MVVGTDFRIIPVMNGQSNKIVQTTTVRFHHIIHFVYLLFHPHYTKQTSLFSAGNLTF